MQQKSPTIGTLNPLDIVITQAYTEQTTLMGWDNLLRGRLSVLWDKVLTMSTPASPKTASASTGRAVKIIQILWDYTLSIWEYRNGVVHGTTIQEAKVKEMEAAQRAITLAYGEYTKDPFIIPSRLRYLFTSKSLAHRLHQDIDAMHCWIRSYTEAKLTQKKYQQRYAEAAKKFFQPKNKTQPPTDTKNMEVATPVQQTSQDTESSNTSDSTISSKSSTTTSSSSSSDEESEPNLPSSISVNTRRS
jgi:hypothetical protein